MCGKTQKGSEVSKGENSVNEAGPCDTAAHHFGIYLTRKHMFVHQKHVPECHDSSIGNVPKADTAQMSINGRMDK